MSKTTGSDTDVFIIEIGGSMFEHPPFDVFLTNRVRGHSAFVDTLNTYSVLRRAGIGWGRILRSWFNESGGVSFAVRATGEEYLTLRLYLDRWLYRCVEAGKFVLA
jgi:hypothetical protein